MKQFFRAGLSCLALFSAHAVADDLSGERQLPCSTLQSQVCLSDGECTAIQPAEINVPQFIRRDAKSGTLAAPGDPAPGRLREASSAQTSHAS